MASELSLDKPKSMWGGGVSPFSVSWGKMYMWFFLVSDAFTFSALLIAYGFMRHKYADIWPDADAVFTHFPGYGGELPLAYVALMTFILIMSSVTMVMAVDAGHRRNNKEVSWWMIATIIGGLIFLGSQAYEWYHFIHGTAEGTVRDGVTIFGANLIENEYGHTLFANFFFFITGFHGFHVFSGVVINFIIWLKVIKGDYIKRGHYEQVEKTGLYWHFVDLVWVFVFTFFYLV